MDKNFIVKEKESTKSQSKTPISTTQQSNFIYTRQFYATPLPQRGLEILAKVIYADFKAHLCCQNNDN